jgi:hypothetical protein
MPLPRGPTAREAFWTFCPGITGLPFLEIRFESTTTLIGEARLQ